MVTITTAQTILGGPGVPAGLLSRYLLGRGKLDVLQCDEIAAVYTAMGELTTIGNLVAFAQGVQETGGFTSDRWVKSYNPAGLGATNDGSWGNDFPDAAAGVLAQFAHLVAYAAKDADLDIVNRTLVRLDPRIDAMTKRWGRGCAPRWVDLNGRWAVPGSIYGQRILVIARQIAGK